MAVLIPTSGPPSQRSPAKGEAFTLAELQTVVGGYIEVIRTPWVDQATDLPLLLVLNEDGKSLRLPINAYATDLMRNVLRPDDVIVGDVLVCTFAEAGETDDPERTAIPDDE